MANPVIQIKRSAVAGKTPTISNLQLGELAVNTYDGKVYLKQDQGGVGVGTTVIAINPWSVGLGSNTYNTYFTAGSVGIGTTNPAAAVTISNTAVLAAGIVTAYKFYGDGSNLTGLSVNVSANVGTSPPASPSSGSLWYNSNLGRTFIYYNDGDSSQWVDAAPFNIPTTTLTPGRTDTNFTATAGQTVFYVSYTAGYVDVYLNGIRLTGTEYIATNGTSVTLIEGAAAGDIVSVVELRTGIGNSGPPGSSAKNAYTYTATASQTTFSATYSIGYVDVYLNGIKLTSSEYTATDGSTVVLNEGATVGDIVEIIGYQTYSVGAYAISAGIATVAQGLTGTPNIIVGVVTATKYFGDGSSLTGVSAGGGSATYGGYQPVDLLESFLFS